MISALLLLCHCTWMEDEVQPVIVDRIAIKVNDKIITERELMLTYEARKSDLLRANPNADVAAQSQELWDDVVKQSVEQLLLFEKAVELGIDITGEAMESRLQSIKESNGMSDDEFAQVLFQQTGMSVSEYASFQAREESAQRVVHSEVLSKIEVEDSEISKYYDEHQKEFMHPAGYRIAEVVFLKGDHPSAARIKAAACLASIQDGMPFPEAAKLYSDSPSKDSGGDLGQVEYGDLNQVIEDTVKAMEINQVSDVLETPTAYFVIKVLNKTPARLKPIDDVKDEIRETLAQPRLQTQLKRFIEDLKQSYLVDITSKTPPHP